MQLPNIKIQTVGTWKSPNEKGLSRPRFVLHYELECYLGENGESWIDENHNTLQKGSLLFCRPGQLRFSRRPFTARFIHFDVVGDSEFTEWLASFPCSALPSEKVESAITQIERLLQKNDYSAQIEAQTLLLDILIELSKTEGARTTQSPHPKQEEVFRAIQYMKNHLYESCRVSDFAAQTGYSVPHFNAFFRQLLNTTPYEYYMTLKLLEAKRLLLSGKHTSAEISSLLGFSSSSHFCAVFRESTGQTPLEFVSTLRESTLSDEIP